MRRSGGLLSHGRYKRLDPPDRHQTSPRIVRKCKPIGAASPKWIARMRYLIAVVGDVAIDLSSASVARSLQRPRLTRFLTHSKFSRKMAIHDQKVSICTPTLEIRWVQPRVGSRPTRSTNHTIGHCQGPIGIHTPVQARHGCPTDQHGGHESSQSHLVYYRVS